MQIRILQWNVWYKEDIEKVVAVLKQLSPDIACLQELTIGLQEKHPDTVAYLAAELGNYTSFHEEMSFPDLPYEQVNAILSRFPLSNQRTAWINEPVGNGHFDDEYRSYIEASVDTQGKSLKIGTTHMSYTHEFQETERKKEETDKLVQLVESNDTNFLLLGDLNALPGSYTVNKLSEKLQNAGPEISEKTWTTKPFSYDGFDANTLDWRLDYAFASPDIKMVSAEIIQTDVSDHLPVLITIEI
jgi:endonuclease/exonuclease/phosphatase family metal-dependent hydrolase